ncbi:RalBP1-associated Eps domain-containing protein 2 [Clonorchis sinensis]|uniref:RalBP1-associated Eps domain-containing protein 2 n=1 Tax=Clonorchis sinensis TaxID=79923 RepID=G7YQQ3_CLOSI|nr:RalBP1-associated Eps domain-containing protein 2 [Clonorchis sinensis]
MEGKRQGRNTWAQFDDVDYNPATRTIHETRAGFPSFQPFQESHNLHPSQPPSDISTPPRTVTLASQVSGYDESSFSSANAPFLTEWPHPPVSNRAPIPPPVAPALEQSATAPIPDPWVITSEQKAYYLAQFLRLQPDPRSKLSGLQAKTFFQLSKLPNTELSDIWELSDADCDGQLTLGEFCVAMHLVVLRRNGIPVPRILPCALLEVISSQSLSTLASGHHNEDVAQSPRGDRFPACISAMDRSSQKHTFSPAVPRHSRGSPITPSPVTPNLSRQQRRWSISSQSDISSIAEGIMHFESRPNADPQLQHPIPVRAHTLPREGTDSEAPQPYPTDLDQGQPTRLASSPPPPPPPRARLQSSLVAEQRKVSGEPPGSMLAPSSTLAGDNSEGNVLQVPPHLAPDQVDSFTAGLHHKHPVDKEDPAAIVAQLRRECDGVSQANEKLAHELMQLQQRRIALKILLERLMPLDAGYPTCFEY